MLTDRESYLFECPLQVRDYECDLQGIVNNAVYQNYLEHARHEFLHTMGLDFAELHKQGIDPVVIRVELDYKAPLRSGDRFVVRIRTDREGYLRFIFFQDIYRVPDEKLVLTGKVITVCVKKGKPALPEPIVQAVDRFINERNSGSRA